MKCNDLATDDTRGTLASWILRRNEGTVRNQGHDEMAKSSGSIMP